MIKIGSSVIPTKYILAPMAGCTDLPFRLIAREHGAKFCFFEMVDCNSITYGQTRRVLSILKTHEDDTPIAAQLLGRDPEKMLDGAKFILKHTKISFIDINAACPAKKVIKKKSGSYLLNDELELCKIIKKLSGSLDVPVTVKIRAGYEEIDKIRISHLAKKCEKSGAQAIFIHGRTKDQGYAGGIDYASIKAVKESVNIPVVGSGNIFSTQLADQMMSETGCDGVLVARGALGNPWIFAESGESSEDKNSTFSARKNVLKKHLEYIDKYNNPGPNGNAGCMRKIVIWYVKGFPMARRAREKVSLVNSYEKMLKLIDSL